MFQRLLKGEGEVAAAERRLELGRAALAAQAPRTRDAVKARLSRPDALLASAGMGVLYGLWVTGPAGQKSVERKPAEHDERPRSERAGRSPPIPGWLVRAALSMIVSRLMADPGAGGGAAASEGGAQGVGSGGMGIEP